ncbi:MAG: beta-glucosidase BglX [Candidatus Melainabacteria bacterium]|nr:beta-glucosidase BglX [Candidatus Melainabacteria bacterium]
MKLPIVTVLVAISAILTTLISAQASEQEADKFITDLMNKMTLEEKLGQMNLLSIGSDVTGPIVSEGVDEKIRKGLVGGVFNTLTPQAIRKLQEMAVNETRLKIPLLFGYDVIHGHRTIFPINLGMSCSWDLDLIERTASAAAAEASAEGLNWVFSPMVDTARDPRWGRVMEGSGEDPYLGSEIAKAMVRGYQGDKSSQEKQRKDHVALDKVLACVKHCALYGAAEAGRDYNTVDMSQVRMFNEYMPPYKAAVDAGVASVMTSFNEINGVPATANKWLVDDVLRKKWEFKGFICTDYTAVNEMINHGVGDEAKVAELAINAGIDQDMVGELFLKYGVDLVKSGRVPQAQIDAACRRVLEAKYRLGLFENPYRFIDDERWKEQTMSADKLTLSKEAAIKSMVLLKNDNHTLPLNPKKKVAFVGPFVKDQRNLLGSWCAAGEWQKATSVWQALETKSQNILYAKGCNITDDDALIKRLNPDNAMLSKDEKSPQALLDEAIQVANQADTVVAILGEPFGMSGEASCRSEIGLFENQLNLLKALKKTGKPIVLVLMNGRPLTLKWESANIDSILETWFSGTKSGDAIVDILFGDANPSGKLTMSFPVNTGQIPIYYNAKNTGRPYNEKDKYRSKYLDAPNAPLYAFGHGLSYTTFEYGYIKLSSNILKPGETLTVSITVRNSGSVPGVETVQLYTRDLVGSITRPVKELKGFQKVALNPDETKTVTFKLTPADLKFYNSDIKLVNEAGEYQVFVGGSSDKVKDAKFTLRMD